MSEPDDKQPSPQPSAEHSGGEHGGMHLTRRGWTILLSMIIVLAFGLIGSLVRVPYVSLGPGPTHDTLAKSEDGPVIAIDGRKTYETSGELRLTTVSVNDGITLLGALGLWVSGDYALAPREIYYPPGETDEEVKKENTKQFQDSQGAAVSASLQYLKKSGVDWADEIKVGVVVKELTTGGPADKVLDPGDQLLVVNGKKIGAAKDVRAALKGTKPTDKIEVTYRDEGESSAADEHTGTITLGKADDDRKQGYMGLLPAEHPEVDDLKVDIKLADVGGPSAGLMFALAVVDRLTPDELAGGRHIAGTGEITEDGTVGAIGGISFKLAAARDDGATVFLVPEGNCAEAKESAPDGLRLVKVGTLTDAVDALEKLNAKQRPASC